MTVTDPSAPQPSRRWRAVAISPSRPALLSTTNLVQYYRAIADDSRIIVVGDDVVFTRARMSRSRIGRADAAQSPAASSPPQAQAAFTKQSDFGRILSGLWSGENTL